MSEVITNNLDLWTSTYIKKSTAGRGSNGKQDAYGIKKLRELILELAVMGKLVPQDPNDEPAGVLLERIAEEKTLLIEEGKIKKQKNLPKISGEEKLFVLPRGWEWERLENVVEKITDGEHLSPNKATDGVMLLTAKHVLDNGVTTQDPQYVLLEDAEKFRLRCDPNMGDVLVCSRGTIGRCCVVDIQDYFCLMGSVILIRALEEISPYYLNYYLKSNIGQLFIRGVTKGMAVNALYLKDIKFCPLSIPPFEEQQRIVAKVNELMALCDQLEQQQTDSLKAHQTLVETLLGTLTSVGSQKEFAVAWSRIANHFDTLFTTDHSIDQLKQTILQLAVMGKLVPQDSNDEPAGVLLDRIAEEKERLIKEGIIKKQQLLPEVADDEKPFEIPLRWQWTRLGLTGIGSTGKTPSTGNPEYYGGGTPFLGPGQITPDGEILDSDKSLTEEGCEYTSIAEPGDLLMVCIGGSIGKSAITGYRAAFNQQINNMRPIFVDSTLLNYLVNTPYFQEAILEKATGSATPIINRSKWEELLVPLPPENEQHRIVAKVDKLMALCDALKTRLADAQTTQIHLADAIVEQAVA